jgi:superfamily II DNA/RNA helicase
MKLSNLKTIIFEEADRTLDMGFEATVSDILTQIASKIEFTHIQKLLVSAHFNTKVTSLL